MHLWPTWKKLYSLGAMLGLTKAFLDIPFQDSRKEFHCFIKNYHWLFLGKAVVGRVQKIGHFLEYR